MAEKQYCGSYLLCETTIVPHSQENTAEATCEHRARSTTLSLLCMAHPPKIKRKSKIKYIFRVEGRQFMEIMVNSRNINVNYI